MNDIEKAVDNLRLQRRSGKTEDRLQKHDGPASPSSPWPASDEPDKGDPATCEMPKRKVFTVAQGVNGVARLNEKGMASNDTVEIDMLSPLATSCSLVPEPEIGTASLEVQDSHSIHGESEASPQPSTVSRESLTPSLLLPLVELSADGYLVPETPKGRLTEEYRRVKRQLLKNLTNDSQPENSNIIMVTSSVTGEGKTFTALNLAMSFALERNRTVLLVDGDVIKRSAGQVLGVDSTAMGLTDLLSGDWADMRDAILSTNVPGLSVLPAGTHHDYANELLSSDRMKSYMTELAERYGDRIIILDSPPILQTNEANILADYAGQIVFVVAEADTPQKLVTQALDNFDSQKYVGILLNKSCSTGKMYRNGYNYHYDK